MAAGSAQVTASVPGAQSTGMAHVTVTNDPIEQLLVDPPQMDLAVGDTQPLRVQGYAACGTHEMFPHPDLQLTSAGPDRYCIQIQRGNWIDALKPGQGSVAVDWQNRLKLDVPVSVTDSPFTDLRIEPAVAVLHPGQGMRYQVSALRGGQRRMLGPEDGLELLSTNPGVAQVGNGTTVLGSSPGSTNIVARFRGQQTEAALDVTPGDVVMGGGPGGVYVDDGGYHVVGPGYTDGYVYRDGVWVDDGTTIIDGGIPGVIGPDVYIDGPPLADAVGLQFVPEVLRLPLGSAGSAVQVVEVLADGTFGRDVTGHPELQISDPQEVATREGNVFRPAQPGQESIGAKLGLLTADPLLVSVGEASGIGGLIVQPNPLLLSSGSSGGFDAVMFDPGDGQLPYPIENYRLTPAKGQGIVESLDERTLRGLAPGMTQVRIAAADPAGSGGEITTIANVEVMSGGVITLSPAEMTLKVGETTPPLEVTTIGSDGIPTPVPATVESLDENIVVPDPLTPGAFVAQGLGETQILARYRGSEATAAVIVTGDRFLNVESTLHEGPDRFEVSLTVLAAGTEGPLEYRAYGADQPPAETWVPSQMQGDQRMVTLRSPPLPYGLRGETHQLILEARDPNTGSVEQYPYRFRLRSEIEDETRSGQSGAVDSGPMGLGPDPLLGQ